MSGELAVMRGVTTAVAPLELEAAAIMLGRLAAEAAEMAMEIEAIDRIVGLGTLVTHQAPYQATRAEYDIEQAVVVLAEIQAIATALKWSLQTAADGYEIAERMIELIFRSGSSDASWMGGLLARFSPLAAIAAGGLVAAGSDPQIRGNPWFVSLVRESTMNLDDAAMGFLGVPRHLAHLVGDEGLGLVGLGTVASVLGGAGIALGLVRDTPVRIANQTTTVTAAPPAGFEERLERVPHPTDDNPAQVVVERYEIPGKPDVFVAYSSGTVDFNPLIADEPFDSGSNILNVTDAPSASAEAIGQALTAAGADSDSPVHLVGYSQGGASSARVAGSGEFDVQSILTFGSPTGQIPIPVEIPAVIVEHTDDLVPALGGRQENTEAMLVTRRVFEEGQVPPDEPVPAHIRSNYGETARLMDAEPNPRLAEVLEDFRRTTADATSITTTRFEFARVERVGKTG